MGVPTGTSGSLLAGLGLLAVTSAVRTTVLGSGVVTRSGAGLDTDVTGHRAGRPVRPIRPVSINCENEL